MIYGNLRDRWQHSSTVPTRFAGQDGDPAIWCMYNGYKQARRPGGQPHFRLGQIFACNMYLASLKRSYEGGPSISFGFRHRFTPVMHGIHSSYAWFIMFHHGPSWFGSLFIPIGPIGRSVSQENVAQSRVRPGPEDQLMVVVLEVTWCRDLMFLFNVLHNII